MQALKSYIYSVIFLLFFIDITVGQTSPIRISPQDYYNFYNSINEDYSMPSFFLVNNPATDQLMPDTIEILSDSIFSIADKIFFKEQLRVAEKFKWTEGRIRKTEVIKERKINRIFRSENRGWELYHTKFGKGFARYSIPIFSMDGKYCIVYKSWNCGGLCGSGGTYLYQKIDDAWIFLKWYSMWIS